MHMHTIPEGTSEPQDFTLLNDGTALDGTAWDVDLVIVRHPDQVVTDPPTVAWLVAADGTVRVSGAGTLTEGVYYVRFKLTDAGDKVGYVPNGVSPMTWRVVTVA